MVRQFDRRRVCPFKLETFEGTGRFRVSELAEAYASYVAQELVPLGVVCWDRLLPVL